MAHCFCHLYQRFLWHFQRKKGFCYNSQNAVFSSALACLFVLVRKKKDYNSSGVTTLVLFALRPSISSKDWEFSSKKVSLAQTFGLSTELLGGGLLVERFAPCRPLPRPRPLTARRPLCPPLCFPLSLSFALPFSLSLSIPVLFSFSLSIPVLFSLFLSAY